MKKNNVFALEIIFKSELLHALGNDLLAEKQIEELKGANDYDEFFNDLKHPLKFFYTLQSTQYKINYNIPESDLLSDLNIDKRQGYYTKGVDRRFNKAELRMINKTLKDDLLRYSEIDLGVFKSHNLDQHLENLEDFIIYTCYSEIVSAIGKVQTAVSTLKPDDDFRKHIRDERCEKLFDKFFGKNFEKASNLEELKRNISAKLMRFRGPDRFEYWKKRFRRPTSPEYHSKLDAIVTDSFSNYPVRPNFMAKFICLLLFKYHVRCHSISERRQYPIFHKHEDGRFAFLSSFMSYKKELRRCQKIFTFVRFIAKYYPEFFTGLGGQNTADLFQAIAYLRRGNTFFMQECYNKAFNDYTYGQTFLIDRIPPKNKTYAELITCYGVILEAICVGTKGECYRQDYDYDNAYKYYCQSVTMFEVIPERLDNISWAPTDRSWEDVYKFGLRYNLHLINKAKMFLVKGDFRRSLKWYLSCLINFFNLYAHIMDPERKGTIEGHENLIQSLQKTQDYLEETKNSATINKRTLTAHMVHLTNSFESFLAVETNIQSLKTKCLLTGLMSDIYNRISMLLYLLTLPSKIHKEKHKMAYRWLNFALEFNPYNGLARYNELIYSILDDKMNLMKVSKKPLEADNFMLLKHDGSLFDRFNRHFSTWVLQSIQEDKKKHPDRWKAESVRKHIAANMISRMFQYTDNFSLKNKEIFKYLTRARTLHPNDKISTLHVLRRWSSFTPAIPRPSTFYNRGGGFFVTHNGKGIAIDPGFNFVLNLYQEGFSVNDVDAVIITHDHIDHHADFDTLLTLWHLNRGFSGGNHIKEIFLSAGLMARYNFLLTQETTYNVYPLKAGSKVIPSGEGHAYEIIVHKAIHRDLSTNTYSIGFILDLKMDGGKSFQIGFTGDTQHNETILENYIHCNVILFNLCSLPFREMKYYLDLESSGETKPYQYNLKSILSEFEKEHKNNELKRIANQVYYAFWYPIGKDESKEALFNLNESSTSYTNLNLGDHLYLKGILEFNKMLRDMPQNPKKPKLVVITELKEDIGSFRTKIAEEINQANGNPDNLKYLTGDIGMTVQLWSESNTADISIQVSCSRCRQNNDYLHHDIFHPIHRINDFCIKGEEEGVFYLCKRHDIQRPGDGRFLPPKSKVEDEIFYQKIERYNVFGKS